MSISPRERQDRELEPWPLATTANLRVLAWPRYDDMESLARLIKVVSPLFNAKDSVLCLRYDRDVDIPYDDAVSQHNDEEDEGEDI